MFASDDEPEVKPALVKPTKPAKAPKKAPKQEQPQVCLNINLKMIISNITLVFITFFLVCFSFGTKPSRWLFHVPLLNQFIEFFRRPKMRILFLTNRKYFEFFQGYIV